MLPGARFYRGRRRYLLSSGIAGEEDTRRQHEEPNFVMSLTHALPRFEGAGECPQKGYRLERSTLYTSGRILQAITSAPSVTSFQVSHNFSLASSLTKAQLDNGGRFVDDSRGLEIKNSLRKCRTKRARSCQLTTLSRPVHGKPSRYRAHATRPFRVCRFR